MRVFLKTIEWIAKVRNNQLTFSKPYLNQTWSRFVYLSVLQFGICETLRNFNFNLWETLRNGLSYLSWLMENYSKLLPGTTISFNHLKLISSSYWVYSYQWQHFNYLYLNSSNKCQASNKRRTISTQIRRSATTQYATLFKNLTII